MKRNILILAVCIGAFVKATNANAGSQRPGYWIDGPVQAEVIRVLDGDTVEMHAYPWPQQSITVKVRLRGIDAPEIHTRCNLEKIRGYAARDALQNMLHEFGSPMLTNISGGKYFGRVLASLEFENGQDASVMLLQAGLVRAYDGKGRSRTECK